jgi:hypothetical protein
MAMATATFRDWPRWRRWGACGSFSVLPAWIVIASFRGGQSWALWTLVGVLAAVAVGFARPSVRAQVFSRAIAWLFFVPSVIGTVWFPLESHRFGTKEAAFALASGAALGLAAPALSTKGAYAEFAPVAYRRWFLAACITSVAAAVVAALGALVSVESIAWDAPTLGLVALSFSLFASAVGVLRMRAWGVLLGAATTLATAVAAIVTHSSEGWLAIAAAPGLMFGYPVLASKLLSAREPSALAVAPRPEQEVRVRIAQVEAPALDEAAFEEPLTEATSPPPPQTPARRHAV